MALVMRGLEILLFNATTGERTVPAQELLEPRGKTVYPAILDHDRDRAARERTPPIIFLGLTDATGNIPSVDTVIFFSSPPFFTIIILFLS